MDAIRQWAMIVCITLVGTSVFSLLIPKGNMSKVVKFTISLFFISSMLYPFVSGTPAFDFSIITGEALAADTQAQLDETADEQFKAVAAGNIRRIIEEKLGEEDIEIKKIEININIDETNRIDINELTILLDKSYANRENEIRTLLSEEVGVEAIIQYDEDMNE